MTIAARSKWRRWTLIRHRRAKIIDSDIKTTSTMRRVRAVLRTATRVTTQASWPITCQTVSWEISTRRQIGRCRSSKLRGRKRSLCSPPPKCSTTKPTTWREIRELLSSARKSRNQILTTMLWACAHANRFLPWCRFKQKLTTKTCLRWPRMVTQTMLTICTSNIGSRWIGIGSRETLKVTMIRNRWQIWIRTCTDWQRRLR